MARKPIKAIAVVAAINALISSNKAAFKAGTSMSEQDFLALAAQVKDLKAPAYQSSFSSNQDLQRYNLRKLSTYTKFNKILNHRGIIIKAQNYYTSFEVVDTTRVSAEVERISDAAVQRANCAQILRVGADTYKSKFSKLKSGEILRVASHF